MSIRRRKRRLYPSGNRHDGDSPDGPYTRNPDNIVIALIREPEGKDDDCDYVCNFGYDKDHWTQPLTGIPVEGIINLGHGVECAKFVNDGTTHPEVTITPLSGGVVEHSHIQMVSLGTLSRRQAILGTVMKQQIGGVTIDTPGELARYNYRYEAKFR